MRFVRRARREDTEVSTSGGLLRGSLTERILRVALEAVKQSELIHEVQLLTYLKLTGLRVGLLISFKHGIIRRAF